MTGWPEEHTNIQWTTQCSLSSQVHCASMCMMAITRKLHLLHFSRNEGMPSIPEIWPAKHPLWKKRLFWGGKTQKKLAKFFLRLLDAYKKYILQKNWVKTAIPALSSGQNNLQTPIWGCHRQLDDQHRNPNMNNKDHIVGQLTTVSYASAPV